MDYAGAFGGALNMTMDQMMELFPKMGAGVEDVVKTIVAKVGRRGPTGSRHVIVDAAGR
jgi:hypothetical protein